ncbi:hypothetical protein [Polyangium sp. y55x31]|uniref:hypothetical protein n=1 Tax=Polyangium sp. y55x31 TaxID=3042688 RepID=UPI0024823213|nr:hypothetical protein [Polyangium sp. y55x31]MDI1484356.1 hypothetical protein [Polyangium sp. y55x31]
MRRLLLVAAASLTLAFASSAAAAPKEKIAFRLDYHAPDASAGCPDAEELALMMAGEFGYLVVRTDVSAVLRVEVRRVGQDFEGELWAPDPSGNGKEWHSITDKQGTCRELAYDMASLVRIALGPRAWGSDTPPPELAAPTDIEVGTPEIHPVAFRMPQFLAALAPGSKAPTAGTTSEGTPVQVTAALGPVVSPLGLPSVAVGGQGMVEVRWPRFALAADMRGVATPASGIGPRDVPARTSFWSGTILPCARAGIVDICGAAAIGRMTFHLEKPGSLSLSDGLLVGFGARLAARWSFAERYSFLFFGEGIADVRSVVFRTAGPNSGQTVEEWRAPPVRLSLGILLSIMLNE